MNVNERYLVDVIGFNAVERSMLASIFALAARRDPGFLQYDPASTVSGSADIYLVDAENAEAVSEFKMLSRRANLPAVMIGANVDSLGYPMLPRPLQWARLLQALEETVMTSGSSGGSARDDDDGTLPLGRTLSASLAGRTNAPHSNFDPGAQKRAAGDTVLVVDDTASVRMFMKAKLAPFQFEVDFAETEIGRAHV